MSTLQIPTGEVCFYCKMERYPDDGEYVTVQHWGTGHFVLACDVYCQERTS